ncbi:MAG: glycosyltransferase [Candidatus Aminicenantes bacterium]|nr:glycosyltransferase [Candidatus Aminicenantes bacterium]
MALITFLKDYLYLINEEKYDIIHCHVHFFCGFLSFVSKLVGAKLFISHSHITSDGQADSFFRNLYRRFMRIFINIFSNYLLAVSNDAGEKLFGTRALKSNKFKIIRCGIAVDNCEIKNANNNLIYDLYNIKNKKIIIGNVARFHEQKNHIYLLAIMKNLIEIDNRFYLILVGDGPLRNLIQKKILEYNLFDNVRLLGSVDNASAIMNLFDVFIMPSKYEGLPVAALEAQAAGIPVILSDRITNEVSVVEELVTFLALEIGPSSWAQKIISIIERKPSVNKKYIKIKFEESGFSLDYVVKELTNLYERAI